MNEHVQFGSQRFGGSVFPYTVFAFFQVGNAGAFPNATFSLDGGSGQKVARHLYFYSFRGFQAESYCVVVMDFGGYHGGASPQSLLCKGHNRHQQ